MASNPLQRAISTTRRRLALGEFIGRSGRWLAISVGAALTLLAVDRFTAANIPLPVLIVVALSGLPVAIYFTMRQMKHPLEVAVYLDHGLGLKDRIGSAWSVERTFDRDNPMAELMRRDAVTAAQRVDPRRVAPLRWGQSWAVVGAFAAVLVVGHLFLPEMNIFRTAEASPDQARRAEARARAADAIRQTAEQVRTLEWEDEPADPSESGQSTKQEALTTLERLAEQFSSATPRDPSGADDDEIAEAAQQLNELADRLHGESEALETIAQRAAEQFRALDAPTGGPADDFAEALRDADFDRAAEWLQDMERRLSEMDDAERRAMARQLEEIARRLDESHRFNEARREAAEQRRRESLEQQGMPRDLLEEWEQEKPTPDEVRRALEDLGVDPDRAADLAEQMQREAKRDEMERRASEELDTTSRQLEELARSISEQDGETPEGEAPQPQSGADPDETTPDATRPDEQTPRPDEGQRPAEAPEGEADPRGAEPVRQPGQQEEPGEPSADPDDPQRPGEQPREQPDPESTRPGQERPQPGEQESESPQPDERTETETTPGEPSDDPSAEQIGDADCPDGDDAGQPGRAPSHVEQMRERLEQLARARDRAQRQQQISDEMRRQAQELLDQMTPEEREELHRWAREMAREQGATPPGATEGRTTGGLREERPDWQFEMEDVDFRRDPTGEADRVIAEWFTDDPPDRQGIDRQPMSPDRVRRAAEAMERALNEEAVPPRYRQLIRNWARRLPETVEPQMNTDERR